MPIVPIADPADPRLDEFRLLPDAALLRTRGLFIAEGRLLVRRLLFSSRYETRAVAVTEVARRALSDALAAAPADTSIFVVDRMTIESAAGYHFHRGALAVGVRQPPQPIDALLPSPGDRGVLVALDGITDADNMGGIFRNARALGAGGVLLAAGCVDPLYRKALRTSMGAALEIPFAVGTDWADALAQLRDRGFTLVALSPDRRGVPIEQFAAPSRLCLVAGAEGEGLGAISRAAADVWVRIPMAGGVDSLNVATATGIALHRFGRLG